MRSLEATPGGGVATSGLSLAANYVVPNTIIAQSLGRLPANALATGTTTVNLLNPGELYTLERTNLVDMRFAKILQVRRQPAPTSASTCITCSTRTSRPRISRRTSRGPTAPRG